MEQESSSKRFADQLQGASLQDQAIRPIAQNGVTLCASEEGFVDRLVLDYGDRIVRGYADRRQWPVEENRAPTSVSILPLGSKVCEEISLDGAKAVSFVKSFDDASHEELRFHDHLPPAECLWVRLTFMDGEILEGMIRNGPDHLLRGGFYLSPADQQGNSLLIYVLKHKLRGFQVLGLRPGLKIFSNPERRTHLSIV